MATGTFSRRKAMAILDNSKRRLPQAVYARVRIRDKGKEFRPQRPWIKWGLVAAGKPSREELAEIRRGLARDVSLHGDTQGAAKAQLAALATIEPLVSERGNPDVKRVMSLMAEIEPQILVDLADRLIRVRSDRIDKAVALEKRLRELFKRSRLAKAVGEPTSTPPTGFRLMEGAMTHLPGAKLYLKEGKAPATATVHPAGAPPGLVEAEPVKTEMMLVYVK